MTASQKVAADVSAFLSTRSPKAVAVAECIKAAGFDGMARQFVEEPTKRAAILTDGWLRREITRRIGPEKTAKFYALAFLAIGERDR